MSIWECKLDTNIFHLQKMAEFSHPSLFEVPARGGTP